MEDSKPTENKLSAFLHTLRQHWPLFLAGISLPLLILYIFLADNLTKSNGSAVFYPALASLDTIRSAIACVFPFTFVIVVWAAIERRRFRSYDDNTGWSDLVAIGLTIVAGFLACTVALKTGLTVSYMHKDSVQWDGQVFNLASLNTYDDLGYGYFVLYRCNDSNLHCFEVYKTAWGYDTRNPAELVLDSETRTIAIGINDEVVYTYPIE